MLKKIGLILAYVSGGILLSVLLSSVYYVLFSLVFSTDVEKGLEAENSVYRDKLPEVARNVDLIAGEMEYLRIRDENIYKSVFKADAPAVEEIIDGDILSEEKNDRGNVVKRTYLKSSEAIFKASEVEDDWRRIFELLNDRKSVKPPLRSPVEPLNYTNVGASVGERLNPFYKVNVQHNGMDIIAPVETEVRTAAPGYVNKVQRSEGGMGNMVEIVHPGNYVTRYAHLSRVNVFAGTTVGYGRVIGTVGNSGRSFTNHLHYEVLHNGEVMDPAHFFFSSLNPEGYLNVLIMNAMSGQSMD